MHSSTVCVFIALAATAVFGAPERGPGNCQGLGNNGDLIDSATAYYLCQDGKLFPKGCLTPDQKRFEIGQTGDYKDTRYSCSLGSDGKPAITQKACVRGGTEVAVGQQIAGDKNAVTCQKDGDNLALVVSGCVDGGKAVNFNDKVTKDKFVYTCDKAGARLVISGCVQNGKSLNNGEAFEDGAAWYNCTRQGPKPAGCISQGKRLNEGDRFFEKDVVMECNVDDNKVSTRATGCLQHDTSGSTIERNLGCYWVEGQEPLQYEWNCKHDKAANTAVKVQTKCMYRVQKGVYDIEPGCFRTIDKAAFGCVKAASGELSLQSFQGPDADKAASGAGLRAC